MNIDQGKIIKMVVILALLCVVVKMLTNISRQHSESLGDYANANPDIAYLTHSPKPSADTDSTQYASPSPSSESNDAKSVNALRSNLTGALLNASLPYEEYTFYSDGFYYAPLSENLKKYITGVSYPPHDSDTDLAISLEELNYVHVWHYNFDGEPVEGELICNGKIAQDMVEIFYELYRNEYQIEKVLLIDEYDGDDTVSMEDNNTSCFNYRVVDGSTSLSKHAYGLAIDVNPFYNPYITYTNDGTQNVSPKAAEAYADRSISFPYKIDENDLCYKLFTEHGFIWGGNWNSVKDYQHFQKAVE